MMTKKVLYTIALFFLLLTTPAWSWQCCDVFAANLTLESPSTVTEQQTFDVHVKIDAGQAFAFGSDATVLYPASDLDLISVTNGGFFSDFYYANSGSDRLELHGFFSTLYEGKSGTGTLATLRFKAKKSQGNGSISFVCAGSGIDTQILTIDGNNILSCSSLHAVTVSYLSPHSPTASFTPTSTPQGSTNKVPVCQSMSINPSSSQTVPITVTVSCKGYDSDNDLVAAEFSFGDGQTKRIDEKRGTNATYTTTHQYTQAGTYILTCKLQDNNAAFSQESPSCKAQFTATVPRVTKTLTPTPSPTIVISPTPQTVIMYNEPTDTPIPTLAPLLVEIPKIEKKEDAPDTYIDLIIVGLVTLGIVAAATVYYFYQTRKSTRTPKIYKE